MATQLLFSQSYEDYLALKQKGDSLNKIKDYKNAALAYTSAIRTGGSYTENDDKWTAACYWMAANYPDSAFKQLDNIASSDYLTFEYINDLISDDECFSSLHTDIRWQDVKDKMLLKAYNIYLTALKEGHGDGTTSDRNELAIARSLGNNNDSAIFHLNDEAYVFLKTKQFNKAYRVIKASINHLLPNYILYQNMVDYYMATGDKGRAYIYYSRAEVFKYKQPNIISDSTLKIDSSMKADYRNFSKKIGYEVLPPECLVKTVANTILKKGMAHKAYVLLKMNIENYPNSFSAYKEMGNYYAQENDKEKANEYFSKSLILQYKLPVTFFQSSFNIEEYFNSHYEDLSKNKGDKIFFSEPFFNSMGNQFMSYKMFDKAELFFKMNVEHYPQSLNVYSRLSAFYKTTGNIVKEEEFEKHVQAIKTSYQQRGIMGNEILPDTTYNIQVAKPTCLVNCPTISVQINGRWANGRYKPFANLIANDGFRIINSREPFTKQSLAQLMS